MTSPLVAELGRLIVVLGVRAPRLVLPGGRSGDALRAKW